MVERVFYSGELRSAVSEALSPVSDGKERVTALETLRARQNFPLDVELTAKVFDALQTVADGTVFSEGEVQAIEELENGRDFLKSLDTVDLCFKPVRLFGRDSAYATTENRYEAVIRRVEQKTGVTVTTPKTLSDIEHLLRLEDGMYNQALKYAHDRWGVTELSLKACHVLFNIFKFERVNRELPKTQKVERRVRLNRKANPGRNDDAVLSFHFSGFRRFRRYLRFLGREEATLAAIREAFPDHTPEYPSIVSARITEENLTFARQNSSDLRLIYGGSYTVDVQALNHFVNLSRSIPGFLDCLTAFAGTGLVMDSDVFIGSSFNFGAFTSSDIMDDLPWQEMATPLVLERTAQLAKTLPEEKFIIKDREALATYVKLIQTDSGFKLIASLMDPALSPKDLENRLNGLFMLARHRQPAEAERLAPLWPPLGPIDQGTERIEALFLTDTEKFVRLGEILKEHYAYLVGNGAFRLRDHAKLLNHLDVLADPDFAEYFGLLARRFRLSASEAEGLLLERTRIYAAGETFAIAPLIEQPYPKTPEEKASAQKALKRTADVYQPDEDNISALKAVFLALQELNAEETGYYDTFFQEGLIRTATQAADFAYGIPTLLTSPYVKALLEDGTLKGRWRAIHQSITITERNSPYAILQALAAWPTDRSFSDIHRIASQLKSLQDGFSVSLEETVYFALSPANEAILHNAGFETWGTATGMFYQKGFLTDGITLGDSSPIATLTHIYSLGHEVRKKLATAGFAKDWETLGRIVIGPFAPPYNLSLALLLLEYPHKGDWDDFKKFVTTVKEDMPDVFATEPPPSRNAQRVYKEVYGREVPRTHYGYRANDLYKIYWLIVSSPAARRIWEACLKDPLYNRDLIYKDAPVLRTEENPGYDERPEWSRVNPLFRFLAIITKEALSDKTMQELIAQEITMDISDKTTEHGGTLFMELRKGKDARLSRRSGGLDFTLHPVAVPSLSVFDRQFTTLDPCSGYGGLGLLDFHLHAVTEDMSSFTGPSEGGDIPAFRKGRKIGVVMTATGGPTEQDPAQGFNTDVFGYAGTLPGAGDMKTAVVDVVDLGNTRADSSGGEILVTPEPFGHGEDLGRFFEEKEE